jgi:hypothetical protein
LYEIASTSDIVDVRLVVTLPVPLWEWRRLPCGEDGRILAAVESRPNTDVTCTIISTVYFCGSRERICTSGHLRLVICIEVMGISIDLAMLFPPAASSAQT